VVYEVGDCVESALYSVTQSRECSVLYELVASVLYSLVSAEC